MEMDQETVYGTHEDSYVMSEKVQSLANSIYQEFSRMIQKYDEDVVKDLVPLVVNVLECLDISYTETQEHEVELELLREDNEQLVTQYEREKQLRKASEQKCLEIEDAIEGENKELQEKIESLESIMRMFELKSKNTADHVLRLEEKETENKKEYAKLHERYTELFKTHMDYMERTKILFGTDRLDQLAASSKPSLSSSQMRSGFGLSYNVNSMEAPVKSFESPVDFSSMTSPNRSSDSNTSLKSELQEVSARNAEDETGIKNIEVQSHEMSDKGQLTDEIPVRDRSTITRGGGWVDNLSPDFNEINSTLELEDIEDISQDLNIGLDRHGNSSRGRPNNLYQELTFQDTDALGDVDEGADITDSGSERAENDPEPSLDVNDNFFGMGKEVENLIHENNELLATKNALNIVKDDLIAQVDELASQQEILHQNICSLEAVKEKLKNRVTELESELKRMREESQKNAKVDKSDDEEDVPMAQRKRFTRLEMARVLMERNQYKERFMELQEAVRWTEMIRASRTDPTLDSKKNRSTVWKFFSSLFSSSEKPQRKPHPYLNVKYNAPTHHVSPALDTMRKNLNDRRKGLDFLDSDIASEKLQAQKAKERREQYKQVRAHVKKDDGRMQAYGWSLPTKSSGTSKFIASDESSSSRSSHVPVPVPVYCRPLMEKQADMKKEEENGDDLTMQATKDVDPSEIWCAAGVNMSGGRTRDGGNIVGTSVFYSNSAEDPAKEADQTEVEKLNKELEEQMKDLETEKSLSSLVWICTSNRNSSRVSVIDANNPADVLGSFHVCTSHLLCIASVPGAKENDYPVDEGVACSSDNSRKSDDSVAGKNTDDETSFIAGFGDGNRIGTITFVETANVVVSESPVSLSESTFVDGAQDTQVTSETRLMKEPSDIVKDGLTEVNPNNEIVCEEMEKMSSVLPTMWLGAQNGKLYVHSAVTHWRRCLHSVRLADAVLSIVHIKGRVLVALADGTVAIFRRGSDGQWNLGSYHLLDLGKPHHSIRCMVKVHDSVWCGYRNRIHVVDPKTMEITKSFDAHPRKESQVRQMAWIGDGVWVSIRLDSTLRLYHASSYQHLQDVDIEPYVSKMLGTGKLGFSFVRITALLISTNRLWMGTSNGVIISVPLSESMKQLPSSNTPGNVSGSAGKAPGGVVRVYTNPTEKITPGSFIPYCSMAQAQLSFHGHRDAVKFFVAVPGADSGMSAASSAPPSTQNEKEVVMEQNEIRVVKKPQCMLVVSGGEGYIDFRIGDGEEDESETGNGTLDQLKPINLMSKGEPSHLIVWQVISA